MKIKDQKIGSQLIMGFAYVLLFVMVLGLVSHRQSSLIHQQTEDLYNHPLQVRIAIGDLQSDILSMRLGTRDLLLSSNERERQEALQLIELSDADIQKQFASLKGHYIGNQSDIDDAYKAYVNWRTAREENTRLALLGKADKVKESVHPTGNVGIYRDKMLAKIKKIDDSASRNEDSIFAYSTKLKNSLGLKLILLVIGIILLTALIGLYLLKRILTPIAELTRAASSFHEGDMNARSNIDTKNEFGSLSDSFNTMVSKIQVSAGLVEKSANLAQLMLLEEEPRKFFKSILPALSNHTNSQMAAVYLLSQDKKRFEHFESYGMVDMAWESFAVDNFEGEFGPVLATKKVHKVKRIPKDTRFLFHTVSGKLVPREIITIPIISGAEIIAIISLASVRTYSEETSLFIENTIYTLSARIEGVLAYQKMQDFLGKLECQNSELEAQKIEMEAQSNELTEQNRELEIQKVQLNEANRLKTNFLSNMSHELRTPLNSVIALSGVLSRRLANKIPSDEFSYLEVIERNGKHLLSLINDILDISRIESGKEEVEVTRFTANSLISDIVNMIKPQAEQKDINLIHKSTENDILITNDVDKCRHILQNLVGNAVKFTEKGVVEVSAIQSDGHFEILITDTGIGISDANIVHIFDEFRQADGGTSRKYGGTGLGLAIAKKYANLLGGDISVKSKFGEGSTFTLTLPLNYSAENKIIQVIENPVQINPVQIKPVQVNSGMNKISEEVESPKTILLVEDSEPAIIQIKDFMEESGYKVLVARGGNEALEVISHTIPDAMILDLMMPEVDGFEVLRNLREAEQTAHIPVLILTAKHITKDDLNTLKRNKVYQLIQKGDVNRVDLLNSVSSLLYPEDKTSAVEGSLPKVDSQPIAGKPTVLIVEDNHDNMITVKAIIGDKFRILEAKDGIDGVAMAEEYLPNLILMDIALPGMDGVEAFKLIRKNGQLARIPIIALTASAMTSDRETILAHGFDAYLVKPIDEKVFFNTINEVLYGK